MRETRVYLDAELDVGVALVLPPAQARHVAQVLRLRANDSLTLFNGDGHDYAARLADEGRQTVRVCVEGRGAPELEVPLRIRLALGISKGERMDFALQKAVELGVARLTPLFTERSQVKLSGERLEKRMEHWRGIVVAACEQSGRRRLPALDRAEPLETWLKAHTDGGLLLDPTAPTALPSLTAPAADLTLLIGPEGGLSQAEREQARARGFEGVRLGPRILRTETAPLAAIAIAQALWGDLRDA